MLAFNYPGLNFDAQHGPRATFGVLKQKMFASWALLKRQYGRLQCLSSVDLMLRLGTSVVQSTACHGYEVWGAALSATKQREELMKGLSADFTRDIRGSDKPANSNSPGGVRH